MWMRTLTLALALLVAIPAFAQVDVVTEPDRVVYSKAPQAIEFTPADVVGARDAPGMARVYARPKVKFRNLIEMRANFRPEMAKSRDAL